MPFINSSRCSYAVKPGELLDEWERQSLQQIEDHLSSLGHLLKELLLNIPPQGCNISHSIPMVDAQISRGSETTLESCEAMEHRIPQVSTAVGDCEEIYFLARIEPEVWHGGSAEDVVPAEVLIANPESKKSKQDIDRITAQSSILGFIITGSAAFTNSVYGISIPPFTVADSGNTHLAYIFNWGDRRYLALGNKLNTGIG